MLVPSFRAVNHPGLVPVVGLGLVIGLLLCGCRGGQSGSERAPSAAEKNLKALGGAIATYASKIGRRRLHAAWTSANPRRHLQHRAHRRRLAADRGVQRHHRLPRQRARQRPGPGYSPQHSQPDTVQSGLVRESASGLGCRGCRMPVDLRFPPYRRLQRPARRWLRSLYRLCHRSDHISAFWEIAPMDRS
jgi:hypothetical protein